VAAATLVRVPRDGADWRALSGRYRVHAIEDDAVVLEQAEAPKAPSEPAPQWPEQPWERPISRNNWVHAVRRAIENLPAELRSDVAIRECAELPPHACPSCGSALVGTRTGRCLACHPGESMCRDLSQPRQRVAAVITGETTAAQLDIVLWESRLDASRHVDPLPPRYEGSEKRPCIVIDGETMGSPYVGKKDVWHSLGYLETEVRRAVLRRMTDTHGLQYVGSKWYRRDGSALFGGPSLSEIVIEKGPTAAEFVEFTSDGVGSASVSAERAA
jgi:hypothetical protein